MSYFTYREQSIHYFQRPHAEPARVAVESPAAWKSADVARDDAWRVRLTSEQIAELDRALDRSLAIGARLEHLRAADFPLPKLGLEIDRWRRELDGGRGFLVVSGLPVERWGQEASERLFWCLGLYLGPIVLVDTRGFFDPLLQLLERCVAERFMGERHRLMWSVVATPQDAVEAIRTAIPWNEEARGFAVL